MGPTRNDVLKSGNCHVTTSQSTSNDGKDSFLRGIRNTASSAAAEVEVEEIVMATRTDLGRTKNCVWDGRFHFTGEEYSQQSFRDTLLTGDPITVISEHY